MHKNETGVVFVRMLKELMDLLICPDCKESRIKTHARYLPVPEGHILGEEFIFSCSTCKTVQTVRFLPASLREIDDSFYKKFNTNS